MTSWQDLRQGDSPVCRVWWPPSTSVHLQPLPAPGEGDQEVADLKQEKTGGLESSLPVLESADLDQDSTSHILSPS